MNNNSVEEKKEFARACSKYAKENNLPFQVVLALKMSEKRISECIFKLKELNKEFLRMSEDALNHYHHALHDVSEYRCRKTLEELNITKAYARFINEPYIKNIIWLNTKFENED